MGFNDRRYLFDLSDDGIHRLLKDLGAFKNFDASGGLEINDGITERFAFGFDVDKRGPVFVPGNGKFEYIS